MKSLGGLHQSVWNPHSGLAVVVLCVSSALLLLPPLLLKFILDEALPGQDFELLWALAGLGALLYLLGNVLRYVGRNLVAAQAERLHRDLRERVFQKLLALDVEFHATHRVGQLAARAQFDTGAVKNFAASVVPAGVDLVVTVVGTALVLVYLEPNLLLLAFIPLPGALLVAWIYKNRVRPLAKRRNESYGAIYGTIHEALHAIEDVKVYDGGRVFAERLDRDAHLLEATSLRLAKQQNRLFPTMNFAISMVTIGVLVAGGYMVAAGSVTIGTLVAFYYYVGRALGPLRSASGLVLGYYNAQGARDRIDGVLSAPVSLHTPANPRPLGLGTPSLRLEGVWFSYGSDSDAQPALRGMDLELPAGHRVALLGPSGSGKSTTGKLLVRFFDPQAGRILRDGAPLAEYDLDELRSRTGYIGQQIFLFDGSIRDNIIFGARGEISEDKLMDVVRMACVDEIIARKGCDLDAPVGEGGVQLSGGQKKRIALARALLRGPDLLVIDQLAADLQEDMCRDIFENIRREGSVSILYLGHRVPAGFSAHAVYWMEDGVVKRRMSCDIESEGVA